MILIHIYFTCRCIDIPVTHRGRRSFCLPLLVIPGPKEPPSIAPYLRNTLEAFKKFGPFGDNPLHVKQCKLNANGQIIESDLHHRIFLSGVTADTPANQKLSRFLSHAARLACPYCWLLGNPGPNGHGMYFPGYSAPTDIGCPNHLKNAHPTIFGQVPTTGYCGDSDIKIDSLGNLTRTLVVDDKSKQASSKSAIDKLKSEYGVHELSEIFKYLGDYVDINDVWQVPLCHAALLGIVKLFLKSMIDYTGPTPPYAFSKSTIKLIKSRAAHVILTDDFNRPYRDIVDRMGNYVMEDWLHFMESGGAQLLLTGWWRTRTGGARLLLTSWWRIRTGGARLRLLTHIGGP